MVIRKVAPTKGLSAKIAEQRFISRRTIGQLLDASSSTVIRLLKFYRVPVYVFRRGPGLNCLHRYLASDIEKFLLVAARASHPGRRLAAPRRPGTPRG